MSNIKLTFNDTAFTKKTFEQLTRTTLFLEARNIWRTYLFTPSLSGLFEEYLIYTPNHILSTMPGVGILKVYAYKGIYASIKEKDLDSRCILDMYKLLPPVMSQLTQEFCKGLSEAINLTTADLWGTI